MFNIFNSVAIARSLAVSTVWAAAVLVTEILQQEEMQTILKKDHGLCPAK